ncbi:MAG: HAD family hydrolase [Verrucomicrobiales bacterium]|nr:HAD family hydrolase [Verrucomicrobiales bacterium]
MTGGHGYKTPSMNIKAITLDVGGTLIEPWPSVGHVYAEVAAQHGVNVDPAVLNQQFVAAWHAGREFDYSREAWAGLVDEVFAGLSSELPSQTFFAELYERFAEADTWRMFEDVRPALACLKERGMRMAVLSNWDERLRSLLDRLELTRLFEEIFVSAEMELTKPDGRLFDAVAERMGVEGSAILHVGDSRREDLKGALSAGWQGRLLCRDGNQHPIREGQIVTSLRELAEITKGP